MSITSKIRDKLIESQKDSNQVSIYSLRPYIEKLKSELKNSNILFDLTDELLLGGLFSDLVRRQ